MNADRAGRPPQPCQEARLFRLDDFKANFLAKNVLHFGSNVGNAVDEAELHGAGCRPEGTGEQFGVWCPQFSEAALLDEADEDIVHVALNGLEACNVVGVFGEERVQLVLVDARRVNPALDTDLLARSSNQT